MGRGAVAEKVAKRNLAEDMLAKGKSYKFIADSLSVSIGFVRNVRAKKDAGLSQEDAPRTGRPTVTSPRQDRSIVRELERDPFASAATVRTSLELWAASLRTVRRRIRATGRRNYTARKKCCLSELARLRRLRFCRRWRNFDFHNVIFTDEKRFCFAPDAHQRVWCQATPPQVRAKGVQAWRRRDNGLGRHNTKRGRPTGAHGWENRWQQVLGPAEASTSTIPATEKPCYIPPGVAAG